MKTNIFFLLLCFISIITGSCKDDSANNPVFGEDEIPYIYTDMQETASAIAEEVTEFKVLVSPADDKTTVKWLLEKEVIGTKASLVYTFPTAGTYRLRIEVTRNGLLNYRNFTLTVAPPTPKPEEPEEPTDPKIKKVIFSYLSNGAFGTRTIAWNKMTHLCVMGSATADGGIQSMTAIQGNTATVKEGQAKGVKILMSIALDGIMKTMTEASRIALGEKALKAVKDYELDGIDIIFEGWVGSSNGGSDKAENLPFVAHLNALSQQLKTGLKALGEKKLLTIGVKGDHTSWGTQNAYNGDFSMFEQADYINVMIYSFTGSWASSPVAQHSSFEHFVGAATQWSVKNNISKSKLLLGVPAYAMEFQNQTSPTGAKHKAYKAILAEYPAENPATKDEFITSDGKVVYYNGHPLVQKKADYVKENDYAGIMLFELSEDSEDDATSLLQVIYNTFKE